MIKLRPMTSSEYPAYCDYFIDDYSREIAENYDHSIDKAIELANQELLRSFPNGLETDKHELLCIESDSELAGYLWHSINADDDITFAQANGRSRAACGYIGNFNTGQVGILFIFQLGTL